MADASSVTIYPLGGLGEIGMNCMVVRSGKTMFLIDCGLMFPEESLLGVDVVIPCFDFILANKRMLKGIVLTHGHEDHIGALPWLLNHVDCPVYGSRFTQALVEGKMREHGLDQYVTLRTVKGGDRVRFGDMAVNFIPVCHSIIDGFGLGIETPAGRIVHTGDFKIDRMPLNGHATNMEMFREFSKPGVQLLMSDSTNVERDGYALTEREISEKLDEIFSQTKGRLLFTLFSSHIQRMQEIIDLAAKYGRKVAVSGKSMHRNIEFARALDQLRVDDGQLVSLESLRNMPDSEVVVMLTGSQGEPLSAMARLAKEEHRYIKVHKGDMVIMSSRFIPGNTRAITRIINKLYKLGAEVLYERVRGIHASGHAHSEELGQMLDTVQPKFFIPVHGEYRHLVKHCRLAVAHGVAPERALVVEDGNPVTFFADGHIRHEDRVPTDSTYVDGKGVGDVGESVLKERQLLAGDGLVVVTLILDEETGEITLGPEILSRGFIFEKEYAHLLEDAKCIVLDIYENIPPGQTEKLKERIRSSLRRFFRKVLERDPVVLPVVGVL
ncbi:MAG: ribonuclease J [Desulfovibrio sp.]|uniref:ribonuclease J n=1 Tax=Desulfovibrio sp. 7SRBS1 TaxID=3378064 RepID=UPI003B3C9025